MELDIVKIDNLGQGIGYFNNKIIFVPFTLPGDRIIVKITQENKKCYQGKLAKIIKPSILRVNSICPYFAKCGGCQFLNTNYDNSVDLKFQNLQNMLIKNKITLPIDLIKNENPLNYRNKISLKIVDGKIGFYENKTNQLIEINHCYLSKEVINALIKDYQLLNIINGSLTIRTNYNNELLIIIESDEQLNLDLSSLKIKHKILSIIYNNKVVYGENNFIEMIDHQLFIVSYNSFFQVNNFITAKIFDLISSYFDKKDIVLDLYSGVGTLSLVAAKKAEHVYGIEIVPNAIINALKNKKMNKINNVDFILGDLTKKINFNKTINTIIVDPPRSGLSKEVKTLIKQKSPNKLIYISCNPLTLLRDLKELNDYKIRKITVLDMFSFTYHVETVVLLQKNKV